MTYNGRPVLVQDEETLVFLDTGSTQYGYDERDLKVS